MSRAKAAKSGPKQSVPTMCLRCHLIVSMTLKDQTQRTASDFWECPNCGHAYPTAHWKIREAKRAAKQQKEPIVLSSEVEGNIEGDRQQ